MSVYLPINGANKMDTPQNQTDQWIGSSPHLPDRISGGNSASQEILRVARHCDNINPENGTGGLSPSVVPCCPTA